MDLVNILAASMESICNGELKAVWGIIGLAFKFLLVGIPVILVIMGLIDLGKAVMAGKDDEIKAAQKMLIKRIIYTIVAFLLLVIIMALLKLVEDSNANAAAECLKSIFGS